MLISLDKSLPSPTLTAQIGLALVTRAARHVLYGPEVLTTRTVTLTALRDARFRVLSEMPRAVRDEHKGD